MGAIKPWEELSFQDDYMFKRVMSHKRLCKKMLEKILRIEIRDICYLEDEKTIKSGYGSKGIRLDVYVEDDRNTIYKNDEFVQEIDREIKELKKLEAERVAYMTYAMKIQEERDEAKEEGKIEMVFRYIKKKNVSIDAALDDFDVPETERVQYANRLQQLLN